jgi:hypothetical protein
VLYDYIITAGVLQERKRFFQLDVRRYPIIGVLLSVNNFN